MVSVAKKIDKISLEDMDNLALDMKENEEHRDQVNQMFVVGDEAQLLNELEQLE